MVVENISTNDNDYVYVCKILLTEKEMKSILQSLIRTNCKGDNLTISMELEEKISNILYKSNYE